MNSVNPHRLEGQKTGGVRGLRRPGPRPGRPRDPGRQRRQHQRLLGRASASTPPRASSTRRRGCSGFQAAGAAPLVLGRPVEEPETLATAIRIGNPASWAKAIAARDECGGAIEAVTDDEILAAYAGPGRARRGSSASRRRRPGVAGVTRAARDGAIARDATVVCVLTGTGLKDPGDRGADRGRRRVIEAEPTVGSVAVALGW